jgi:tetratricopeptide (TPR) repeat protein
MRGAADEDMRKLVHAMCLLAACAASDAEARGPSSPNAERTATEAAVALARGEHARALAVAERGLAAHPHDAWLLYDKGSAQADLGQLDSALETLRDAERRFPRAQDQALAVYRRALALELLGRCAESARELERYAALVQTRHPKLAADARSHVAFCIPPTARQAAVRAQTAALERAAQDQRAQKVDAASTASARALMAADYRAALAEADAGLAIAAGDPWLLYNRGSALAGLGRIDEALISLREAERRFPRSSSHGRSVAVYRRAMALEVAGRCDEELAELERYAEVARPGEPAFQRRAVAHVRLCRLASASTKTIF